MGVSELACRYRNVIGTKTASTFDNVQSAMKSQGLAATVPQAASL